ncbi:zinc-dependent metalloprotease family protein [Nocardia abscessus]|uniref:zinc-dependent metalloprotease family protein n=1 Tax=Nocardia abscessus TaxID=120957 RepID=UPI00245876D1|nr:zinc-dependent metalloprotease family protein [Nocardia abscessus]
MATLSVRDIASDCLGKSGDISIDTDVYGYIFRDTDGSVFGALGPADTFPGSGQPTARSLKRHLETISGEAIDLFVFLVGHENNFSGSVTQGNVTEMQYALQVARDVYAQVDLGIRRIKWLRIPAEEATDNELLDLADGAAAASLTDDYSGPDGGIDVFVVQSIGNAAGFAALEGPCDKNASDVMSGAVLEVSNSRRWTGIVLAHEVGHYLGLPTGPAITNLMGVDNNPPFGIDEITPNSTGLTDSQGSTMRSHCSVDPPC